MLHPRLTHEIPEYVTSCDTGHNHWKIFETKLVHKIRFLFLFLFNTLILRYYQNKKTNTY